MNIAIIEDDPVEQMYYKRLFSNTDHSITPFTTIHEYLTSEMDFDFVVSDYYLGDEEIVKYLDNLPAKKTLIVSNRDVPDEILSRGISMVPKPLTIEQIQKNICIKKFKETPNDIFTLISQDMKLIEFCQSTVELNEMLQLLYNQILGAKLAIVQNDQTIEKKHFYHNLINQIRYFKNIDEVENLLYAMEHRVVEEQEVVEEQKIELSNHLTQILQKLKKLIHS